MHYPWCWSFLWLLVDIVCLLSVVATPKHQKCGVLPTVMKTIRSRVQVPSYGQSDEFTCIDGGTCQLAPLDLFWSSIITASWHSTPLTLLSLPLHFTQRVWDTRLTRYIEVVNHKQPFNSNEGGRGAGSSHQFPQRYGFTWRQKQNFFRQFGCNMSPITYHRARHNPSASIPALTKKVPLLPAKPAYSLQKLLQGYKHNWSEPQVVRLLDVSIIKHSVSQTGMASEHFLRWSIR